MVWLEASRGTAYGLCFSQIFITLGVVIYSPLVEVHVYKTDVVYLNQTLNCAGLQQVLLGMPLPFLICSALILLFCTSTMGMRESGVEDYAYSEHVMEEASVWNSTFKLYVYLSHMVLSGVVSTPADAYQVFFSGLLMGYFLIKACAPRSDSQSFVSEHANLLGYGLGAGLTFYACSHPPRLYALFAFIIIDYFLGVGHLAENPAMMSTVVNCRLFYVCSSSLALSAIYAVWA